DVVWDRNGRWVAAIGIAGDAVIIDAATGKPRDIHRVRGRNPTGGPTVKISIGHPPPRGAFSPDGRRFATTSGETAARIWDIDSGEPATPPLVHRGAVWTIRFDRDGRRALTASDDGTAQLWDATSGAALGTLVHPAGVNVTSAVFSPDDTRVATV